ADIEQGAKALQLIRPLNKGAVDGESHKRKHEESQGYICSPRSKQLTLGKRCREDPVKGNESPCRGMEGEPIPSQYRNRPNLLTAIEPFNSPDDVGYESELSGCHGSYGCNRYGKSECCCFRPACVCDRSFTQMRAVHRADRADPCNVRNGSLTDVAVELTVIRLNERCARRASWVRAFAGKRRCPRDNDERRVDAVADRPTPNPSRLREGDCGWP